MVTSYKDNKYLSADVLKGKRILFIAHLAIGDYTYLQMFFKKLKEIYPDLVVDIFIDDVRKSTKFWKWGNYKNYILYDWVEESSYFNKIYKDTNSFWGFRRSVKEARKENYPIVISLGTLRPKKYAKLARKISPRGFVVGMKHKRYNHLKALDLQIESIRPSGSWHITEVYAQWFKTLFGVDMGKDEFKPEINFPNEWFDYGERYFAKNNILGHGSRYKSVFFINAFAKDKKRCWPVDKLGKLLIKLSQEKSFDDTCFIINAPPERYDEIKSFTDLDCERFFLLKADDNFFQLPAIIKKCNFVISVETCIPHLAAALNIPMLALMRTKNPEWIPLGLKKSSIVFARDRNSWIKSIPVVEVVSRMKEQFFAIK